MGSLTFRILLTLSLVVMTVCTRPLQSAQMSLLVISTLKTPPKPLQPPPLSPLQQLYHARQPPHAPTAEDYFHRGYQFGRFSFHRSDSTGSRSETSTSAVADRSEVQYWSFQQLHKNPAGPNPIGNDYPRGASKTANRYPPPYGG